MNKVVNMFEYELCMKFDLNKDQHMIDLLDGEITPRDYVTAIEYELKQLKQEMGNKQWQNNMD